MIGPPDKVADAKVALDVGVDADAKVALEVGVVVESMQMSVGGGTNWATCFFFASLSSPSSVEISAVWAAL